MADRQPVPGNAGLTKFLFTDCGNVFQHSVGTWAGMLIAGEASHLSSALIVPYDPNTSYLETMAVGLALETYTLAGKLEPYDRLTVFSDNQDAVWYLSGKRAPRVGQPIHRALERTQAIARELALDVTYCWVPSHQGHDTSDWRGLINSRVDRQARWLARQEVRRLREAQVT